jgi:hypothetical protein
MNQKVETALDKKERERKEKLERAEYQRQNQALRKEEAANRFNDKQT